MKKVYIALCALFVAGTSFAQTISNAGFETWRVSSSGSAPTVTTHDPTDWYGYDSLIINAEETLLPLYLTGYTPTDLHAQVFQETTIIHGGASAAKLISLRQDTLGGFVGGTGFIAGSISNAQPALNLSAVTGGDFTHFVEYTTPGTATTLRITSVSAWIEYIPGKDSATGALGSGVDTGSFVVQAISEIAGVDSVVGSATLNILPTSSYAQFTANLTYVDTFDLVSSVRINFASGQLFNTLDSSIMYVDDVTMTGIPQTSGVTMTNAKNELVKVYPNPVSGNLYFDGSQTAGYTCRLLSVSGQVIASKVLSGKDMMDVSVLPSGLYFYSICDTKGNNVQRGKVVVNN